MNKNQSLSLIAFLGVVTMMGFQNCSKVGVDDASASSKLVSDGMPGDPSGMGDLPGDPGSVPGGTASMPDDQVPSDTPIVKAPPDISKDPIVKRDDDCDDDDEPQAPELADVPESEAVAMCLEADAKVSKKLSDLSKKKGKKFSDLFALKGPDVVHIRSSVVVVSDDINRVEDIRGSALIKGITSAAHAKSIMNLRGSVIICGMDVEEIGNVRGSLLVVNSSVGTIKDVRGSVRLINSTAGSVIESIENTRGSIELQNTDVKAIDNTRGSIRAVDSEIGSATNVRGSVSKKK